MKESPPLSSLFPDLFEVTMLIQHEIDVFLRTYGKGLSKREKEELYDLLQKSKKYTVSIGQAVRLVPFHAILMSIVLEQEKQIRILTNEIEGLSYAYSSVPLSHSTIRDVNLW